jgi:hypothetical protein
VWAYSGELVVEGGVGQRRSLVGCRLHDPDLTLRMADGGWRMDEIMMVVHKRVRAAWQSALHALGPGHRQAG